MSCFALFCALMQLIAQQEKHPAGGEILPKLR